MALPIVIVLAVIAIRLGIHFYRQRKKKGEQVSISLKAINTQKNMLQGWLMEMKTAPENPARELYHQLLADLDRQVDLIKRYDAGDSSLEQEIDKLQGAIQVKSLLARAARKQGEK